MRVLMVSGFMAAAFSGLGSAHASPPAPGTYDAWLESHGGRVTFTLEIAPGLDAATVRNGEEVIARAARLTGDSLVIPFDPYGAELRIRASGTEGELSGEWVRRRSVDEYTTVAFGAGSHSPRPLTLPNSHPLSERWLVRFDASEPEDAPDVGVFRLLPDGRVTGTILTTTGDWRYLHGTLANGSGGRVLELCSFSGSGSTLIRAAVSEDGRSMMGQSFSGGGAPRAFTARADASASLPDPFAITRAVSTPDLGALRFVDPQSGDWVTLASFLPAGAKGPMLIHLFGTWCPNSNDAAAMMNEAFSVYRARGLTVVGLAFEGMRDERLDRERIRSFRDQHATRYPILLAASDSDKEKAGALLPFLDHVHAYPTSILIDRRGRAAAIYTGFSGPATGQAHAAMRAEFFRNVDHVLTD